MTPGAPLRVAVLTSHSAPGLDALLAHPGRGSVYEVVAVISTEVAPAETSLVESAGVPLILMPVRAEDRSPHSLHTLRDHDSDLTDLLQRMHADYVLLVGYRYVTTERLLDAFPNRVIALHDADLTTRETGGQRRYTSRHAVSDALLAGEVETRSTAYVVSPRPCEGPLFLLSAPYPVPPLAADARRWGDADLLCSYATLHRAWMVRDSWGPMLLRIVELLAAGRVQVIGEVTWVDGAPAPCRMGEAPAACHDPATEVSGGIPASCPFIRAG